MRSLRRVGAAPHQGLIHMRRERADILCNIGRELESPGQNLRRVGESLREEVAEMLGRGGKHGTGRDKVHGAREADQTGEEVRRASLHGDAATTEDKAVFTLVVGNPAYVSRALVKLVDAPTG